MRRIVSFRLALTVCAALSVATATAQQQPQLPDGPGKKTMQKVCSPCHSAENVIGRGKTREEWGELVGNMVERGAQGTEEEFYDVVDYLTKYFPKSAATNKVYVNRAGPKELERELQLTTKEAEAIVSYRGQSGGFKSIDDLQKVPGLDARKLETKKDRLAF